MFISRSVLLRMKKFRIKVVEKNKTHILCSVTFFSFRKLCRFEITWRNTVEPDRTRIIWRKRFACWSTNTHFRICNTAFPLQQCLQERVLVFRYTYISCLVSACSRMHVQIVVSVFEAEGRLISLG